MKIHSFIQAHRTYDDDDDEQNNSKNVKLKLE